MTLSEVVIRGLLLEIRCMDCYAKTPVDAGFFLARRGDISVAQLRSRMHCPGCGSAEIKVVAASPVVAEDKY